LDLGELDLDASTAASPQLVPAGVQEQPVEPGLEAIDVAQRGQIPPAADERLLDGVLGQVGVTKDEPRRGIQPADRGACEHGEGIMIALPRSLHEVPLHGPSLGPVDPGLRRHGRTGRVVSIWRAIVPEGSDIAARDPTGPSVARPTPSMGGSSVGPSLDARLGGIGRADRLRARPRAAMH
jgi:hypothetical protein